MAVSLILFEELAKYRHAVHDIATLNIAIFVLKGDVKLQLTNYLNSRTPFPGHRS